MEVRMMPRVNRKNKNLDKHENGFWYFKKTYNKERISQSLHTKDLNTAELLRDDYNAHLRLYGTLPAEAQTDKQNDVPLWYEVCEKWYGSKMNTCEETTLDSYRAILDAHFLKVPFRNKHIDEVSKKDINHWWRSLEIKTDTINKNLTYMSNVFDFAIDEEWITTNPLKSIKRPKNKGSRIDPFELEQVEIILGNAKSLEYRDYLEVRFFTGLRAEEIDALEKHHVNLKNSSLYVKQAIVDRILKDPKNDSSYREVDLNQRASEALKRQLERVMTRKPKLFIGKLAFKKRPEQNNNRLRHFLFVNSHGNPLSFRTVRRTAWKPIFDKINLIDAAIGYRNLNQTRHTYISQCLLAGENILWVSKQVGHENASTTFKRYARWIKNDTDGSKSNDVFTQSLHYYKNGQDDLHEVSIG